MTMTIAKEELIKAAETLKKHCYDYRKSRGYKCHWTCPFSIICASLEEEEMLLSDVMRHVIDEVKCSDEADM